MVRKLVSATVSAALCLMSAAPAIAQEYRFTGFDAPHGATATVNLRIPLGAERSSRPSYGLTFGYGQEVGAALDGRASARAVNVADFRFAGGELSQARVASFDLANLDRDRRMNLMAAGGKKTWLILGVIIGGVAICWAAGCFDGDDSDESDMATGPTG